MAQRIKLYHDDIQNKIASIIKARKKKYIPFEELDEYDKEQVFITAKIKYGDDFHITKSQGYDVLKNVFFVDEYKKTVKGINILGNDIVKIIIEHIEFENFDDYYNYLSGNVYDKSCYYGYEFSKEEIEKYNLDITIMNFVSFSNDKIKDLDYYIKEDDKSANVILKRNERIKEFLDEYCDIEKNNFNDMIKEFKKKFCNADNREIMLSSFFFPYIKKYKDNESIKKELKRYFINDGRGFDFIDGFVYGIDFAGELVNTFKGINTSEARRVRKIYKAIISKSFETGRNSIFDKEKQLYVRNTHIYVDNCKMAIRKKYFSSFKDFLNYEENDLTYCDLTWANINKEAVDGCLIDKTTKLPIRFGFTKYEIEKKCTENNGFSVVQKWYNNEALIYSAKNDFNYFCDFVYFLNNDLSNTDFILCENAKGLKNLKDVNIEGIRVKSDVAKELGLKMEYSNLNDTSLKDNIETKYEIESNNYYLQEREIDEDYKKWRISYITDIHLIHLFKNNNCITEEDNDYIIRKTVKDIVDNSTSINLIGGDIASENKYLKKFISELSFRKSSSNRYFVTLGNHELWDFAGKNMNEIVDYFKDYYKSKEMYLVHNNLFYIENNNYGKEIKEITTEELKVIDEKTLREKVKGSSLIIFGGLGFAGKNEKFNANNGIYRNTLNREQEIKESEFFNDLYNKVASILYDKNVIIFTHNPKADWSGNNETIDGFVYVNGHRHRNYFYDDGMTRIYADNQVGYNQKNVRLKKILMDVKFDYFSDVEDGIHTISKEEYELFYRGIQEGISVNRDFKQIYLLKKDGNYMFIAETNGGKFDILNGASIKKAEKQSLEYYYENLTNYSNSIKIFLSKYDTFQKQLSEEIKKFGGEGRIHGCIIDIDFLNHIYINPLDAKITPYFAYSMTEKYVYKNLISLLKKECPDLYLNYQKNIDENKSNNAIVPFYNDLVISDKSTFVGDTSMYSISRIIKGLQYTTKYNVVRLWSDTLIGEPSEEKGKKIVKSIIYPNQLEEPKNEEVDYETQKIRKRFKI